MDQIALFFKCQSCSDYVLTSNIQCPNGHQVCQSCFENLSHCPTCHERVAPSTRIPHILTTNVDPILNVGDSFDLLLPGLLRIAPAIHPCSADELIYINGDTSYKQLTATSTTTSTTLGINDTTLTDANLCRLMDTSNNSSSSNNNNLAEQLLMASNSCEVEETLSRLMMLASMSPSNGPNSSLSASGSISHNNVPSSIPPPGLIGSSTQLRESSVGQQQVEQYLDGQFR